MVSSTFTKAALMAAALGTASVNAVCTFTWQANSGDTCASMAGIWAITEAQFQQYNPSVQCPTLTPGTSYCVEWDYGAVPTTPGNPAPTTTTTSKTTTLTTTTKPTTTAAPTTTTGPVKPSPTQEGLDASCKTFYKVSAGDTCQSIVDKYKTFTLADFYKWNPAIGSDCSSLWGGYYVCVGLPGTPTTPITTTTKPATTTAPTSQKFYQVSAGDTCATIVSKYGSFSLSDFYSWNPAVGTDCSALWGGYYVCVGVPGTPSTPTAKPTTTTKTAAPAEPTPTQTGIVSTCNVWYQAKSGDFCQGIVDRYKTFSLQDFYKWNPAVKSDCSGLWVGYYYCVGVKK
ncbi:LysM domain-containing protein [Coniochaeta sp. 2T2.1]|nr:LysM domain-containing protein [Coniochaeta sp. 2T2.1]